MIIGLFIETCIFISAISISHNFFKDKHIIRNKSVILKSVVGVCSSILGIIVTLFNIHIISNVIVDFSALSILLSALYVGWLSTIIASLTICTFDILYFPISKVSIVSVVVILILGIGFSIINLIKIKRKTKWIYSIIYLLLVNFIAVLIITKDLVLLFKVFPLYCFITLLESYIIFKYTEYLSKSARLYKKLKNQASVDFLTGLNNVRQFHISLNSVSKEAIRKEQRLSLLYFDIDYFKNINDTYGHSSGDIVLKDFGKDSK